MFRLTISFLSGVLAATCSAESIWVADAVLVYDSGFEQKWTEYGEEPIDVTDVDAATKQVRSIVEERIQEHMGSPQIKEGSFSVEFSDVSAPGAGQANAEDMCRLQVHLRATQSLEHAVPALQIAGQTVLEDYEYYDAFDLSLMIRDGDTLNQLAGRTSVIFEPGVPAKQRGLFDVWTGPLLPGEERRIEVEVSTKAPWKKEYSNSPVPDETVGRFAITLKFDERGILIPEVEYLDSARDVDASDTTRRAAGQINSAPRTGRAFALTGGTPRFIAYARVIHPSSRRHFDVVRAEKEADFAAKLAAVPDVRTYRATVEYVSSNSKYGFGFYVFVCEDTELAKRFAKTLLPTADESLFLFAASDADRQSVADREFARRLDLDRSKRTIDEGSITTRLTPVVRRAMMERIVDP